MARRIGAGSIAGVGVVLTMVAMAETARLIVRPHGTNQLEFVATSLQNEANYMVLARSNSANLDVSHLARFADRL